MSWAPTQTPWPAVWALAPLTAFCLLLLVRSRRVKYLVAALVLLGLMAAAVALDAFVETPIERVDGLLDEMAAAAVAGEPKRISALLHPDFEVAGFDRDGMAETIERELTTYRVSRAKLNAREYVQLGDDEVEAEFLAIVDASGPAGAANNYPLRLRMSFRRRGDEWLIHSIRRFQPVTNTGQEIPLTRK